MLEEINGLGGVEAIPTMVARAKDKTDPFRLMGFGHRVYKVGEEAAKMTFELGNLLQPVPACCPMALTLPCLPACLPACLPYFLQSYDPRAKLMRQVSCRLLCVKLPVCCCEQLMLHCCSIADKHPAPTCPGRFVLIMYCLSRR